MHAQLSPGNRLGRYEILSPLGAGGMGEVYRARDTRLGRDVALKVLPRHLSSNPEIRARFEREAQTVSSLNHPNICSLYDVGREGDTDYLVMELIEGETLATRLERGPLPLTEVFRVGTQIAEALDRAHRAGVIHRDLKPGNVMLTKGSVKLMDFGLARATGGVGLTGSGQSELPMNQSPTIAQPLTTEGSIVGTIQYMSPEQLEGKEADPRSDIWALGCVLYEMISGRPAFEARNPASLIAAILEHVPAPIMELQPMSPVALDRLVRVCLSKDPDDRLQTAHDVKLQLEWTRDDVGGAPGTVVHPEGSSHRMRWLLALVASVAVAASVAFLAGRQDAPPPTIPLVQYQQKSYRDQAIFSARFMPDEKTIVMSSALDGNQVELFVIRPEYPEPQSLGLKGVHLLAVSSKGELAVLNNASYTGHHRLFLGTLARMPLEGAAPREVMEDVRDADWSPDGEALAIIHDVGEEDRLEYPVGRVLQKSAGYLSEVRVSPDGRFIAFMEHPSKFDDRGSVKIVDLAGTVRTLAGGYWGMEGMAWAPNSEAVFYSAGVDGNTFRVFRADLEGGVRSVSQSAGSVIIHDVAADGSWAVTIDDQPSSILFRAAGASRDVDCSWLANSIGPILSADGKTVLFTDQSSTGGPNYMVTLRPTSGGPILGLGEGDAEAFAPDGKSVLAAVPSTPPRLMVYPVGAGQAVQIDQGNFENISNADWMPDGKRVLVSANLAGQPPRCFLLDPDTGTVEPMGPEGIREGFPSSDGKEFVARSQSGWSIYPMEADAEGRPVPSTSSKDYVIRWDPDGSALFFYQRAQIPGRVDRVEIESGRRETVLTLGEEHIAGRVSILGVSMADDLRSVAYATWDYRSVLYTVERTR